MPPDPRVSRSSSWAMVDNLDALGNFNWPKVIFDNLHASFAKLKHLKDDPDKEQHYFSGFAPIFEAVVFSRIQSLAPKPKPELVCLHPPIQSYSSKRTGWRPLNTIEASEPNAVALWTIHPIWVGPCVDRMNCPHSATTFG
ncbi:unnamed protein product [Vicia faba]|uniref:Uncharacterized protein n=1 Tax=Vicia faba TaxID=3906 RepID=A0AAV1A1L9_VICFA|nr:unnamed protein product [Vicia faba]